ncbi:adenylyltransferase and sulfurtransferase MOCS3 [Microplitis demolitor]|uniref:adenylyltransferase and sulfurtransferase MOCS3 n=1 Tax=Microplitis demolitor TaxID=69319 RepID=UPI0004CCA491|nr:adenylyltransferase and sulfurtransferase MOCS3 [Microplitis demolitor]
MSEEELVREINELKSLLKKKEDELFKLRYDKEILQSNGLNNNEIMRYSRQILVPIIGVPGQLKIKKSSVLIIGAGGLGCPCALYLTGAGVGHIGIIDYDTIELNNLHRQLLFTCHDIGRAKVDAAADHLTKLNNNVKITPYKIQANSNNIIDIIKDYDVVIDATDNVPTRYLVNDACVLTNKPLISGSALKLEGQLTVYNYKGPCYRCIFPEPPPPETVTNCGDGGVLGAAVGTIGVLQALEALKIILNLPGVLSGRLMLFDGLEMTFRTVKLRSKLSTCAICGDKPSIDKLIDYEQFCNSRANDKNPNLNLLNNDERITVEQYRDIKNLSQPHLLIDVRSHEEFQICHLDNATNIPFTDIKSRGGLEVAKNIVDKKLKEDNNVNVYILCRRGNDSQRAVKLLKESLDDKTNRIKDIIGGIHSWTHKIDSTFPIY